MTEKFNKLITETNNPDTVNIDRCETVEMVKMINNEDKKVAKAVEEEIEFIAKAIDGISQRLSEGGRMLYFGAGTSGRLGIIDASECPPTFGTPPEMVRGIIAGGNKGFANASAGNEDDKEAGKTQVKNLNITKKDAVIGISASGRTPYVLGVLNAAKDIGAFTVGICNNPNTKMMKIAEVTIAPVTGPETIQGSTRMKAGTAQKMILNMLSTGVMVKLGKVYRNLMVDVEASNEKLYDRAKRIVMSATKTDEKIAWDMLKKSDYNVKVAIVAILLDVDIKQAKHLLKEKKGYIAQIIKDKREG